MVAGVLEHQPTYGLRLAGAARARGRDVEGGRAFGTEDALAELRARSGVDAPPDFDPARFERSSGVDVRDWCAPSGPGPVALATLAAARALEDAGWEASSLGAVVAATSTPEAATKCMAATVAARLDAGGVAVDVRAGGASGLEAFLVSAQRAASARRVLVVAAEAPSRYANPLDPTNALLFGDGAAALCLESSGEGAVVFGRSARYVSPGRPFSVPGAVPAADGDAPLRFETPDAAYLDALEAAWSEEARALRHAARAATDAVLAPYYVHARQLDRAEAELGAPAPLARELLADGGSIGCAAPLAVLAEARARGASHRPVAALAVGGGISACSLVWTPSTPG
ncbi:MAG: hypothetical protein AAFZ87_06690 [Planctomycetota bacterium]